MQRHHQAPRDEGRQHRHLHAQPVQRCEGREGDEDRNGQAGREPRPVQRPAGHEPDEQRAAAPAPPGPRAPATARGGPRRRGPSRRTRSRAPRCRPAHLRGQHLVAEEGRAAHEHGAAGDGVAQVVVHPLAERGLDDGPVGERGHLRRVGREQHAGAPVAVHRPPVVADRDGAGRRSPPAGGRACIRNSARAATAGGTLRRRAAAAPCAGRRSASSGVEIMPRPPGGDRPTSSVGVGRVIAAQCTAPSPPAGPSAWRSRSGAGTAPVVELLPQPRHAQHDVRPLRDRLRHHHVAVAGLVEHHVERDRTGAGVAEVVEQQRVDVAAVGPGPQALLQAVEGHVVDVDDQHPLEGAVASRQAAQSVVEGVGRAAEGRHHRHEHGGQQRTPRGGQARCKGGRAMVRAGRSSSRPASAATSSSVGTSTRRAVPLNGPSNPSASIVRARR